MHHVDCGALGLFPSWTTYGYHHGELMPVRLTLYRSYIAARFPPHNATCRSTRANPLLASLAPPPVTLCGYTLACREDSGTWTAMDMAHRKFDGDMASPYLTPRSACKFNDKMQVQNGPPLLVGRQPSMTGVAPTLPLFSKC